jgi:hypothetical protein
MPPFVVQQDVELLNAKVVQATMNLVEMTVERKTKEMMMKDQARQTLEGV